MRPISGTEKRRPGKDVCGVLPDTSSRVRSILPSGMIAGGGTPHELFTAGWDSSSGGFVNHFIGDHHDRHGIGRYFSGI